jgi:hypothetical protein
VRSVRSTLQSESVSIHMDLIDSEFGIDSMVEERLTDVRKQ